MIGRTFTTAVPTQSTIVSNYGASSVTFSPQRRFNTSVQQTFSPVRTSVTMSTPMTTVTSAHGLIERARPVLFTEGLVRSTAIVRGALPTITTMGNPVEIFDTGITTPVKPTEIERLPGPVTVHESHIGGRVSYTSPMSTTTTTTTSGIYATNRVSHSFVDQPQRHFTSVGNTDYVGINPQRYP